MRHAAAVALLSLLGAATAFGQGRIQGVVRSETTGAPVIGARLELREGERVVRASTDATGRYALLDLRPGTHRLHVAAPDYDSLDVDVLLTADAPLRLDLTLAPRPASLAPVRVLARITPPDGRRAGDAPDADGWRIDGEALRRSPAVDDADPLQLLATAPLARSIPEPQTTTHVRGGGGDQNRYLLDGAPVYAPVHAGPVPSAFSPDIVSELVLHDGVQPARFGGALSSVVDVRTLDGVPRAASVRGAFGPTSLRGALHVPIAGEHAGLLVSGRHSYSGLRREATAETGMPGTWFDLYGKLTARLGPDVVTLSSFAEENGLGFPATPAGDPPGAAPDDRHNRFDWTSATSALGWRHPLGPHAALEARLWTARLDVGSAWQPPGGALALRDVLHHDGLTVVATRTRPAGTVAAGVEAERLDAVYDLTRVDAAGASGAAVDARPVLRHGATASIASAFVEDRWHPTDAVTANVGVRLAGLAGARTRLEPRLSASVRPSARVTLSAGYARLHQYAQSLRNEESVVGALVSPDLPVATDGARIPVAESDALSATVAFALDTTTRLRLDGFARRSRGLVLVAPATAAPFAARDFAVGAGADWGAGLAFERRLDRLALEGHYAVGTVTRRTADARYHPAFAPDQVASLAVAYRAGRRTSARAAVWAATGRRTTLLGDPVGWDARDAFSGAQEISGSPETAAGPLDGAALPGFLRVDLGLRHTLARWRGGDALVGTVSVSDVLGRENVAGYVVGAGSADRRSLGMLRPSLLLGLAWGY